jgi:hypothetical protein
LILYRDYGFICECPACRSDILSLVEDEQRPKALLIEKSLIEAAGTEAPKKILNTARQLVSLLQSQTAILWSSRYVADAQLYLYHIYNALDNDHLAVQALECAHQMNVQLQGHRSPDSRRTLELLKQHLT